jgi:hypothetical protein
VTAASVLGNVNIVTIRDDESRMPMEEGELICKDTEPEGLRKFIETPVRVVGPMFRSRSTQTFLGKADWIDVSHTVTPVGAGCCFLLQPDRSDSS